MFHLVLTIATYFVTPSHVSTSRNPECYVCFIFMYTRSQGVDVDVGEILSRIIHIQEKKYTKNTRYIRSGKKI